ncbi:MAG: LicD family protein [Acidobacteriota bacterium]
MSGCTRETLRCEFWQQGGSYLRPPCCTAHLKELLFFTRDLLTRHRILHWLDWGALLGAVRSGELVPWDGDVDFGVMREDRERIVALAPEIERAGFQLDLSEDAYTWRIVLSPTNFLHVDLFHWRDDNGTLKMRWRGCPEDNWAFPRSFIENLQPVQLYGEAFLAPAPVDELLSRYRYGDDYLVPRRTEEIDNRARAYLPVKQFLARRLFAQRMEANLDLLRHLLDANAFRDYDCTAHPGGSARVSIDDDSPDAELAYPPSAQKLFLELLPALESAGFQVLRRPQPGNSSPHRLVKEGASFDFLERVPADCTL